MSDSAATETFEAAWEDELSSLVLDDKVADAELPDADALEASGSKLEPSGAAAGRLEADPGWTEDDCLEISPLRFLDEVDATFSSPDSRTAPSTRAISCDSFWPKK